MVPRSTWRTFWEKTTIHGVRNTSDPTMEIFERVIWFFIVCCFTSGSLYCLLYYLEDFNSQVTKTVLSFDCPLQHNRINWEKIDDVIDEHISFRNSEVRDTFKEFIGAFEGLRFGKFEDLSRIENLNLKSLRGIDVSDILEDLSMNCHDVFENNLCYWKGIQYDCCDLFFEEKTEAGVCLVFNSIFSDESRKKQKSDHFYPFANARSGENSGIQVVISIDSSKERPENHDPDGIWMMIKHPFEWSEQSFFIRAGTETSAVISPKLTTSDESIAVVPIEKRNCFFDGEDNLEFYITSENDPYLRKNCITQCHQWYLMLKDFSEIHKYMGNSHTRHIRMVYNDLSLLYLTHNALKKLTSELA
uniref:Uncharacterized protein n=1 Tax=Megaselia scalaris TaxID=36166 RepID=T1GS98_MEGSC